jgi:hypothetical protein
VNCDAVLFARLQSVLTKLPRIGHNRAAPIVDNLRDMRYQGSPTSIFPLFARWRSSLPRGQPPILADALRVEAQRCFRLARGIASFELADELEAIGHAFENEAKELESGETASAGEPFADELAAAE